MIHSPCSITNISWILIAPSSHWKTRAQRGTDRSPEYNEHFYYKLDSRVKKCDYRMEPKTTTLLTHASRSLLWIRFVAVAFRSEEEVIWRKEPPPPPPPTPPTPVTYFASHWICPLGKYGQNIFMHMPGHEPFIPTKFRKHPLSGSVVKAGLLCVPIHIYMHKCTPPLFI